MNTTQQSIAVLIGEHFARQWRQTPRSGPVIQTQEDQTTLMSGLKMAFDIQNPSFDWRAFEAAVKDAEAGYAHQA